MLLDGTGNGILEQAVMLPVDQYGLGDVERADNYISDGKILGIIMMSPAIGELGYYIIAMAQLKMNSDEVARLASRKYVNEGRRRFVEVGPKNIFDNTPETLIKFANGNPGNLAPTQHQVLWLALANQFGAEHLRSIHGLEVLV